MTVLQTSLTCGVNKVTQFLLPVHAIFEPKYCILRDFTGGNIVAFLKPLGVGGSLSNVRKYIGVFDVWTASVFSLEVTEWFSPLSAECYCDNFPHQTAKFSEVIIVTIPDHITEISWETNFQIFNKICYWLIDAALCVCMCVLSFKAMVNNWQIWAKLLMAFCLKT